MMTTYVKQFVAGICLAVLAAGLVWHFFYRNFPVLLIAFSLLNVAVMSIWQLVLAMKTKGLVGMPLKKSRFIKQAYFLGTLNLGYSVFTANVAIVVITVYFGTGWLLTTAIICDLVILVIATGVIVQRSRHLRSL